MNFISIKNGEVFGGVMVSVLSIGPKVRGFKPGRSDGFLRAIKYQQHVFLRRGSKGSGPTS
jgi:hypothetical protein